MNVCMNVCMYVSILINTLQAKAYLCMYVMNVCIRSCVYVSMYALSHYWDNGVTT